MTQNTHHERYEYVAVGAFWDFLCRFCRIAGGGYQVTSSEVPGMLAFGDTLAEARENAREELMICITTCEIPDDPLRDLRAE